MTHPRGPRPPYQENMAPPGGALPRTTALHQVGPPDWHPTAW